MGYLDHPYGPVPNISGLNTMNPIKILRLLVSYITLPPTTNKIALIHCLMPKVRMRNNQRSINMSNLIKVFCLFLTLGSGVVMAKNSDWNDYSLQIGEQFFYIKLPSNESKDFPTKTTLKLVNLSDERLDTGAQSITSIHKYWDFNGSLFQGVQGTLNLKVRVRKAPLYFHGDLTNNENLENLLMERLNKSGIRHPSDCDWVTINEKEWITYKLSGSQSSIDYILPLSKNFYIQVQADFINNSKKENPKWLSEAHDMLATITSSMSMI